MTKCIAKRTINHIDKMRYISEEKLPDMEADLLCEGHFKIFLTGSSGCIYSLTDPVNTVDPLRLISGRDGGSQKIRKGGDDS
jgi:hypothetical protein